jgi:hypothetical protein
MSLQLYRAACNNYGASSQMRLLPCKNFLGLVLFRGVRGASLSILKEPLEVALRHPHASWAESVAPEGARGNPAQHGPFVDLQRFRYLLRRKVLLVHNNGHHNRLSRTIFQNCIATSLYIQAQTCTMVTVLDK